MSTQKSKLDYLKRYESKPQKKKGSKKQSQGQGQQNRNMTIMQMDDTLLEKSGFYSNMNNDIEDEEEDFELNGPQIELSADLKHLTEKQKIEILKKSLNNQEINIKQTQSTSSGKWVQVKEEKQKQRKNSSSSSSDSDSDSDQSVPRRRLDSSDEEEQEDRQQEEEELLKKRLNKALAQENSDSDVSVKRRKDSSDSSSSSDSDARMQKIRKQQKINQNKTVMRNEFGQVMSEKDLKNLNRDKKEELRELQEAQISRFSKGMKQTQEKQHLQNTMEQRKQENFANYADSREHEIEMMNKKRFGDTMGRLIEQEDEQRLEKALGFKKETKKLGLKCKFAGLPNRFDIQPGHRWNGVDLSNGFEKRFIESQNAKIRRHDEINERNMRDL